MWVPRTTRCWLMLVASTLSIISMYLLSGSLLESYEVERVGHTVFARAMSYFPEWWGGLPVH